MDNREVRLITKSSSASNVSNEVIISKKPRIETKQEIEKGRQETRKGPTPKDVVAQIINFTDCKQIIRVQSDIPEKALTLEIGSKPMSSEVKVATAKGVVRVQLKAPLLGQPIEKEKFIPILPKSTTDTVVSASTSTGMDAKKAAHNAVNYRNLLNKFSTVISKSSAFDSTDSVGITTVAKAPSKVTTAAQISSKLGKIIAGTSQSGPPVVLSSIDLTTPVKATPKNESSGIIPIVGPGMQIRIMPKLQQSSLLNMVKSGVQQPAKATIHSTQNELDKSLNVKTYGKDVNENPSDNTPWVVLKTSKCKVFGKKDVSPKMEELKKGEVAGEKNINVLTLKADELQDLGKQNPKVVKRPQAPETKIAEKRLKIMDKTDDKDLATADNIVVVDLTAQNSNELLEATTKKMAEINVSGDADVNKQKEFESIMKKNLNVENAIRVKPFADKGIKVINLNELSNVGSNLLKEKKVSMETTKPALNDKEKEAPPRISVRPITQIQILNGQLSDKSGPIKLLNPNHMIITPTSSTTSSTSSSIIAGPAQADKPKRSMGLNPNDIQQNLLKVFKSQQMANYRNRTLDRIKNSPRRTAGGRSRSLTTIENKIIRKKRMRHNPALLGPGRQMKATSEFNIDNEWDSLTEALTESVTKLESQRAIDDNELYFDIDKVSKDHLRRKSSLKPAGKIDPNRRLDKNFQMIDKDLINEVNKQRNLTALRQYQNNRISGVGHGKFEIKSSNRCETPSLVENNKPTRLSLPFLNDLERVISWNRQNRTGLMPNAVIKFERNEFGMVELNNDENSLANRSESPKIRGKSKKKPDLKKMACNHGHFEQCFNALMVRFLNEYWVNQKTPNEYHSTEFKELIQKCVQQNGQNCTLVSQDEIQNAIIKSRHFKKIGGPKSKAEYFNWSQYLEHWNMRNEVKLQMAPVTFFSNPFPTNRNSFLIGHKLEAIDPLNCSLFFVCTVVDIRGYRIKLHFDGYHHGYDFWTNADSIDIFPAGWCGKTARELQPPFSNAASGQTKFNWADYLSATNSLPAPRSCFSHLKTSTTSKNPFKIGMKLEADDIKDTRRVCVATIGDVIDKRVLVVFDGLPSSSNYWTNINSPYIHPINWHLQNGYSITPPPGLKQVFAWNTYLRSLRAEAVPDEAFSTRNPIPFTTGMVLEVVDKVNPSLIRPARITMVDDYEIKVLFLEWPEKYAFWVDDDSPDIHPVNWGKVTEHPVDLPKYTARNENFETCSNPGCRGLGNSQNPNKSTHTSATECPYNYGPDLKNHLPNRLSAQCIKPIQSSLFTPTIREKKFNASSLLRREGTKPDGRVSLKTLINPPELTDMSPTDIELYRRLQVSTRHLLENSANISILHDKWLEKLQPLAPVRILAGIKNPLNWSIIEVADFVSELPNCSMLGRLFVEHEIDGLAFLSLRQSDMTKRMEMSLGPAIKIFNRIILLREECNAKYIRYV